MDNAIGVDVLSICPRAARSDFMRVRKRLASNHTNKPFHENRLPYHELPGFISSHSDGSLSSPVHHLRRRLVPSTLHPTEFIPHL